MNASNQPRLSQLLASCATVAKVRTKSLGLRRQDKNASIRADHANGAEEGISSTNVLRLPGGKDYIDNINRKATEAVNTLKAMTTQWGEDQRLLVNTNIQPFIAKFAPLQAEHAQLVQLLADAAPRLVAEAPRKLGSYRVDVPTVEEIRDAFALEFEMKPVPDSDNFRGTTLDQHLEQQLRDRFEADIAAAYQHAQQDALARVAEPLKRVVERLTAYTAAELEKERGVTSTGGRLYTTVITNLQEIASVFESFNVTGDPFIQSIADQLGAFEGLDIDDLKSNKAMRDTTAARAKTILEQLEASGWLS